ncbi:MAG: hydroxysqualene dehydroxylase HpnE [Phycisphaerales bacterium]
MSQAGTASSFGSGLLPGAEAAVRGGARGALPRNVVVVGGGIAGIACALRLAEAGIPVTLVETRRKLGGRATSFTDPRTGLVLDNCQHVLMGCCTSLLDLYGRLGVAEHIEWHTSIFWANPPHAPDVMRPGLLPAPAQFTSSLLGMRMLDFRSKRGIARAMMRMLRLGVRGRAAWEDRTFQEFLQETQQTPEAVDRFWNPVVVSACNLECHEAGAGFAMQVFQEGFLSSKRAPAMGLSTVPLVQLYDPAEEMLRAAGGSIMLGVSAMAIAYDGTRVTGVVTDEGMLEADAVVSAVPSDRLDKLLSATAKKADSRLQRLDAVEPAPILGVHLHFPRTVLDLPHLVLPGRPTQWLFNKGVGADGSQHIHAVISGAQAWMELDEGRIALRVLEDVRWALPAARGVEPTAVRSVKEKRATFAARPGFNRLRPPAAATGLDRQGGIRNLYLAGDWTRTGWPATMEGAARSGYAAAGAILGEPLTVPDLRPALLPRLLGVAR